MLHLSTLSRAATHLSFLYLVSRPGSALVTIFAFGVSALIFFAAFTLQQAYARAFAGVGHGDVAVILSLHENTEAESVLPFSLITGIRELPEFSNTATGYALTPEVVSYANVTRKLTKAPDLIVLLGIGPLYLKMHSNIRLINGRMYTPGLNQIIVGRQAALAFCNLGIGDYLHAAGRDWRVVGTFAAHDSVFESEIMTDVTDLQDALGLGSSVSALEVKMPKAADLITLRKKISALPSANVSVLSERSYLEGQAARMLNLMTTLGSLLTAIVGISAIVTSANLMRNSVRERTTAIATLGAIGFPRAFIAGSILIENITLALLGSGAALLLIYVFFNHKEISTIAFTGSVVSSYAVESKINISVVSIGYATILALATGVVGAAPSIYSALKTPISVQIRRV